MIKNVVKEKIAKGETVLGTLVMIPSSAIVEIIGRSGFDFIVIDTEHAPIGTSDTLLLENMIRAAEVSGLTSLVRIPEPSKVMTQKVLDAGAMGVMISGIKTKADAEKIVSDAKYPTLGKRGCCSLMRPTGYSAEYNADYWDEANQNTMVVPLIETKEGVDNIYEILEVEGIDFISFGPRDYTMSIGQRDVNNPGTQQARERLLFACREKGVPLDRFVFPPYEKTIKQAKDDGFIILTAGADIGIMLQACRGITRSLE
jgi:4-hydroxy-2-oxoheptanedioate aldolase